MCAASQEEWIPGLNFQKHCYRYLVWRLHPWRLTNHLPQNVHQAATQKKTFVAFFGLDVWFQSALQIIVEGQHPTLECFEAIVKDDDDLPLLLPPPSVVTAGGGGVEEQHEGCVLHTLSIYMVPDQGCKWTVNCLFPVVDLCIPLYMPHLTKNKKTFSGIWHQALRHYVLWLITRCLGWTTGRRTFIGSLLVYWK